MRQSEIDIHGLTEIEAIRTIEKFIATLDKDVKEIRVIHGYKNGDTLKETLASPHKIRSKRIKRRRYTMNQGETILELF